MQFSTSEELDLVIQFYRGEGFNNNKKVNTTTTTHHLAWKGLSVRNPTLNTKWTSSPPEGSTAQSILIRGTSTGLVDEVVERNVTTPPATTTTTNQQQQQPTRSVTPEPPKTVTPPPRAPLEFKRKPVTTNKQLLGNTSNNKSLLSREIDALKRTGGVVGNPNGPQVQITVFLPNRKPMELRVSKTATILQIIGAVVERAGSKGLGRRGRVEDYELRLHDTDGLPDEDFPAIDTTSLVVEIGSTEFCLCLIGGSVDEPGTSYVDISETSNNNNNNDSETTNTTTAPAPTMLRGTSSFRLGGSEAKFVKIRLLDKGEMTSKPVTEDLRISTLLASIINGKSRQYPLFADNYQLQVTKADMERLGLLSQFCDPQALVLSFGVTEFELAPRRYVDSAPLVDAEQLTKEIEQEARRNSESRAARNKGGNNNNNKNNNTVDSPLPPTTTTTTTDNNVRKSGEDGKTNNNNNNKATSPRGGFINSLSGSGGSGSGSNSTTKTKKAQKKNLREAVNPESILLNEIKAAVYEQWDVIKYNQWNKAQKRVLGVDLQKIYNKQRDSEETGKVQRDERLIADVISIDMDRQNPSAFVIRYRDGPGGAEAVRKYEAEDGPQVAAEIVAKVRYLMSGRV
jgi:hypothetical protein